MKRTLHWYPILRSPACFCGSRKKPMAQSLCKACYATVGPRLKWKLDTAMMQRWYLAWYRVTLSVLAVHGVVPGELPPRKRRHDDVGRAA
jgi:hypothetical protein